MPSVPPSPPTGVLAVEVGFPHAVEPERLEWFLAGTEPATFAKPRLGRFGRILSPASETLMALDPDIPPTQQRVVFDAETGEGDLRWVLNGKDLGVAAGPILWEPHPGRYTLSLVDEARHPLDTVTFVVRGAASLLSD
jgi:penicillin-binding protein 1C